MKAKIKIKGQQAMLRKLAKRGKQGRAAVAGGLYVVANEIITSAKNFAPVDTGALRGSGYATKPNQRGHRLSSEVGFGGPAKAYVIRQHEDVKMVDKGGGKKELVKLNQNHFGGGHAKFLEVPFDQKRPDALRRIAEVAILTLKGAAVPTSGNRKTPGT